MKIETEKIMLAMFAIICHQMSIQIAVYFKHIFTTYFQMGMILVRSN